MKATLGCSVWATHCGFSCGAWGPWTLLLRGMWNLPGSGIKPVSPALVGGFLSTVHQGSPGSLTDNTELIRILYEYVTHVFPMREENVIKKIIRKTK